MTRNVISCRRPCAAGVGLVLLFRRTRASRQSLLKPSARRRGHVSWLHTTPLWLRKTRA